MKNGGFIALDRQIWDHPMFKPAPMSEREAWIFMLSLAAWKDTSHRVGGKMIAVPRGSFVVSLRDLQHNMLWSSDKRVRGFLGRLEAEGMIGRTVVGPRNAPKTHVTICNYDEYQSRGRTEDAPRTRERTHRGRTEDAVKEQGNNITTKDTNVSLSKKPKKPTSQKTSIPPDATCSDPFFAIAEAEGHSREEAEAQFERFRDSAVASGRKYVDWRAAFRNWLRSPYFRPAIPKLQPINGGQHDRTNASEWESDPTLRAIAAAATSF